jgi:hypothetical protein
MFKEQIGCGELSVKTLQQRPESLRIMTMCENGGNAYDISRKESTKTVAKGSDFTKVIY